MPRILTLCPTTGRLAPTGHRTPEINLATLVGSRSFRCPSCQQIHSWSAESASVEATMSLATLRSAA